MKRITPFLIVLLLGGCPTMQEVPPPAENLDSARVIGASSIPEGIYFGQATTTVESYLHNELIESVQESDNVVANFGTDGLPLAEGDVVRPGLSFTSTYSDAMTIMIGTVQASGNRVAVTYEGTLGIGPASADFSGVTLYEFQAPDTLLVTDTFEWGAFADRSNMRQRVHLEATLTR